MFNRKGFMFTVILAVIMFATILAFVANGASKTTQNNLTANQVGIVDQTQLQTQFTDFVKIGDLKKAYDAELNNFAAYQRQLLASYLAELEQKKEQEIAGKTDAEKTQIEAKYEQLARDKATEINQSIQAKMKELQDKLNAEMTKADERLRQTIAAVSGEKDLKLVLLKTAVLYGGVDVTTDVIAKGKEQPKK